MNFLKDIKDKYILLATVAIIAVVSISFVVLKGQNEMSVGADAVTTIAGQTYYLAGSGLSSSATSITLTSFTIPQNGLKITDAMMSETFYLTIEPGSRSRQEIVSCTTVTQNGDGTATLSGCTRGLSPVTPYTASTSLQFAHSGGSSVIFSNPPQLYNQAAFKDNDETITGTWLVPTPLSDTQIATKKYVDDNVNGGTVSNDRLIVAGTAGEAVSTSTLVYFYTANGKWYKTDNDVESTYKDVLLGLTQGSAAINANVSGGILLKGRDNLVSGLNIGEVYYVSPTAGEFTDGFDASQRAIGVAEETNVLYFDPYFRDIPFVRQSNTWIRANTFTATTTFTGDVRFASNTQYRVYTSNSTWTKPNNLSYVIVEGTGKGGEGVQNAGTTGDAGGGGGGGAYFKKRILASDLASTETITISTSASVFGSHATATAGSDASSLTGGAGGTATGGDLNIPGGKGGDSVKYQTSADDYLGGNGGWGFMSPGEGGGLSSEDLGPLSAGVGRIIITEYYN